MTEPGGEALRIAKPGLDKKGGGQEKQIGLEPHCGCHDARRTRTDPERAVRRGMIPHGGNLSRLRRRYPDAPEPLIDLSTGINPYSYPLPEIPETAYTRLPEEVQIRRLKETAAAAYRAGDPDMIAVAPGTQLLISILPRVLPAARVAILSPTYGEHAAVWTAAGSKVLEGDTPEVLDSGDVAVLCNPNNPDGRVLAPQDIAALQARRERRGGRLIVDEAFAEFGEAQFERGSGCPATGADRAALVRQGLRAGRLAARIPDRGTQHCPTGRRSPGTVAGIRNRDFASPAPRSRTPPGGRP